MSTKVLVIDHPYPTSPFQPPPAPSLSKEGKGGNSDSADLKLVLGILCGEINSLRALRGELPEDILIRNGFSVDKRDSVSKTVELSKGKAHVLIAFDLLSKGFFEVITVC